MYKLSDKGRRVIDLEEIYKIICIVLLYPDSGYGGSSFWRHIIQNYGMDFFDTSKPECIRNRWRKIEREHSVDFMEYKIALEKQIGEDYVKKIQFALGMDYMSEEKIRMSGDIVLKKFKSSNAFHKKYNHKVRPMKKLELKAIKHKQDFSEEHSRRAGSCNEIACFTSSRAIPNNGEFHSLLDLNNIIKFPRKSLASFTEKQDLKFHDKEKIASIFSTLMEKAKKIEYAVFSESNTPDFELPTRGWTHLEDVMLTHYTTYIKHLQKSKTAESIKNRQFLLQLV